MDNFALIGRWMLIAGIAIAVIGGIIWLLSRIPGINQIPGTIKIQGSGFTCFIPILASIVISILLTIVLNLIARLINR
ncbi:MAG: DUF2905 domain-containing protein [Anaerolineaceae bacterium]|nr:DUF2905 domain-containing protein [Anaerolineaceae bacterium]